MQQSPESIFKKIKKAWKWFILLSLALAIKITSFFPSFIENYYATGIYPAIGRIQRFLFGWIPFSFGDIIYTFLGLVIVFKLWQLIRLIVQKRFNRQYFLLGLKQVIFFMLLIYVSFYLLWGLNYSRKGITSQLQIQDKVYNTQDLHQLIITLQGRLNFYASRVDTLKRDSSLNKTLLFKKSHQAYKSLAEQFHYLRYSPQSVKSSLYSFLGDYLSFTGYYNPFSGEAQVQSLIPAFLHPFIIAHEIGHQLGYAKEDEANFVGFLACRAYDDVDFRYSLYFELYYYALYEMIRHDFELARSYKQSLHPLVSRDYREWRNYRARKANFIEPIASRFYEQYLKVNNQPLGHRTYNKVVYWLISYMKKNGVESL